MAITKDKKASILEELRGIVKSSLSLVLVNFKGLTVSDTIAMRRALKEKGVGYIVSKNTLTRKALSEGGISGELPNIEGETALVYGNDPILPAQEIFGFQKKFDKKVSIFGGVFEGRFLGKEEMVSVANIPPLKTLHAQFVNIINSPIQGLAISLNEIARVKSS
jgi:large subunit ribosomal protein L10